MKKTNQYTTILAMLGITSAPLLGAGFQLQERSVSGLGRAFSGEAAIADDASVLSSNPAGIILLDDSSYSVGLQYIKPNVNLKGKSGPANASVSDSDVATEALVPYFYYTRKITDNISVGFGMFSSFGLATDYSDSFAAQVGTDLSEITTVTANPSVAVRLNEQVTLGVGIDIMHAEGRLTSDIPNSGGLNALDLEGDDLAIGWNIGILYEISEGTRLGLSYRSSIDLTIDGSAAFGPLKTKFDAQLEVELPDSIEFSAYHELDDQWAVHTDVIWTNWSKFKQLAPTTKGGPPIPVVQENWNDAFRFAIGTTYKHSDSLTFRAGLSLDESPVNTSDRTLRIPDGDRIWASIGATIKLTDNYNLDIGYTHIFADDVSVYSEANGGNEALFTGKIGGDVDIIGAGISGTF